MSVTFQVGGVVFDNGDSIASSNLPTASTLIAGIVQLSDSTSSTSTTLAATANAVKTAYDLGSAALPKAGGTMTGTITFDAGQTFPIGGIQDATTGQKGVVQVGTNISVASGVISVATGSTSTAGILQLTDSISSTSTTTAATPNSVKQAYDAAVAASAVGGITSDTVIYVNSTDGNDATGQRGTTKPFATITAALAAASEADTIFISPGTFTENVTLTKGVNIVGTFTDQATWCGTKILGNFTVTVTSAASKNWAITNVYFISANSTPPFTVTDNSTGAGGINTVTNCSFTQQTSTDPTQYAVKTSGSWTRSLYFRSCTFDGNFHHNAGTAAGANGYVVVDGLFGVGNSAFYNRVTTGLAEFRNPSNTLACIYQTGGIVQVSGAATGIASSAATLNSVFGSAGFSYKGSAASVGTGTVYFSGGINQPTGKVDIGANLVYGWTSLAMDPASLTISGSAVPYTTAVPASASLTTMTQQRPRLNLLTSTSTVTAANQLATVIDSSTGSFYSVSAFDAGTY